MRCLPLSPLESFLPSCQISLFDSRYKGLNSAPTSQNDVHTTRRIAICWNIQEKLSILNRLRWSRTIYGLDLGVRPSSHRRRLGTKPLQQNWGPNSTRSTICLGDGAKLSIVQTIVQNFWREGLKIVVPVQSSFPSQEGARYTAGRVGGP